MSGSSDRGDSDGAGQKLGVDLPLARLFQAALALLLSLPLDATPTGDDAERGRSSRLACTAVALLEAKLATLRRPSSPSTEPKAFVRLSAIILIWPLTSLHHRLLLEDYWFEQK